MTPMPPKANAELIELLVGLMAPAGGAGTPSMAELMLDQATTRLRQLADLGAHRFVAGAQHFGLPEREIQRLAALDHDSRRDLLLAIADAAAARVAELAEQRLNGTAVVP